MTAAIDGVSAVGLADSGTAVITLTLTTTQPNCVIFVACSTTYNSPTGDPVDTMGLAYTPRYFGSDAVNDLALWCAVQPTAGTNVITIQMDGASYDGNPSFAFAVSGTSAFDANASLPAIALNYTSDPTTTVVYSTTGASDLVYGINRQSAAHGAPAGFTEFVSHMGATGVSAFYALKSTPQSSAPVTSPGGTLYLLVDALVAAAVTVDLAGDLAPSLALGAGLTVVPAPANYVDLAGNLGGASSYGVGGYGKGLYSRNGAITPAFAGNLDIVGQDYFAGDIAPVVTFAGTLQVVHGLGSGDLLPIVTFSGNLQLQAGLAGDIAPQVDFSASLTFDMLLDGGFGFTVTFAAAGLISEPLWEETEPCSTPDWEPTTPCPPPAWSATAPCPPPMWTSTAPCPPSMWTPTDSDSVEWEKSELCNG